MNALTEGVVTMYLIIRNIAFTHDVKSSQSSRDDEVLVGI